MRGEAVLVVSLTRLVAFDRNLGGASCRHIFTRRRAPAWNSRVTISIAGLASPMSRLVKLSLTGHILFNVNVESAGRLAFGW